jgi:YVTN family beta-propeller protein
MSERLAGTVTFLFSDIEGSTKLLKQLGRERYGELLARQQALLREVFAANGGEEIDTQGDSFFVAFRSASSAVAAAVALERALAEEEWPGNAEVRVRVGIHTGEAAAAGERYVGFSVHRAARIGAVAHGGQVLLSSSTRELVEDDLPEGVLLRDLGLYRLKDVERPERISQVGAEGLRAEFPPLQKAERVKTPVLRRRSLVAAALVGVVAAAVAVPLLALSSGGSGSSHSSARLGGNSLGAVDLSTGQLTAAVSLGASPNAVASGAGSIWVALSNRGVVERIDPTTNTIQQTIVTPGGPSAIAVGGGFVWVAETLAGAVVQIDPRANGGQRVATTPVGNGPSGIAYGLGAVWVANSVDDTVIRIDPATGTRSAPISVDAGADAIAVGDGAVWVVGNAAGVLSRIDPEARGVSATTSVGNQPVAVAAGPGAVWVANSEDGTVSRIDASTGHLVGLVQVGKGPSGVAVAVGGSVWVSNELSGTLSEIDPQAARVVKTVAVGGTPQGVALSGNTGYVAVQESAAAHRGGTLTLVIANPPGFYTNPLPHAFDPASGYGSWELTTMTNDGLLGYSRAGGAESYSVVPDLAVALPTVSDGGKTYTFQLRQGIRYSTGGTVQPADVRRGIERALLDSHGSTPGSYMGVLVGAKGCLSPDSRCDLSRGVVTSPGSTTVAFHLTSPDPDFLFQLALPTFDAVPASTPLKARLPLPATGPYEIASYQPKPGVVQLIRNPRFRVWSVAAQPSGYPDRIVERYRYTGTAAVRAVEQGKADITADGLDQTWPPAVAKSLQTRYSSQLYEGPLLSVLGLWLNTRVAPFNDVSVRQALNYASDRNRLVAINGGSINALLSCQILTEGTDGYQRYCPFTAKPDATGTYHGPDLARARRLVAESGTKGQPVTIWFYDIPIGRRNGAYFVSVLKSLGYKARLMTIPHTRPTWAPNRQAGVAGYGGNLPSANDVFSSEFTCDSYTLSVKTNDNYAGFCDRRVDAQIARARALQTSNPSAAAVLWASIDREVTNEAPWVAMKATVSTDFVSRRAGNYRFCWLSGATGLVGACLDQLWVR